MKIKLTVAERILLANGVLPSETNFVTLKIVRKLKEEIGFCEDELNKIEMKMEPNGQGGTRFDWNPMKEEIKEFEFGELGIELIRKSLIEIGERGKATMQHLSLYEKFISGELTI